MRMPWNLGFPLQMEMTKIQETSSVTNRCCPIFRVLAEVLLIADYGVIAI